MRALSDPHERTKHVSAEFRAQLPCALGRSSFHAVLYRKPVLAVLLGLIFLSFFGMLGLSASMFPENYDWRYRVISNLLSPRDNPNHYRWTRRSYEFWNSPGTSFAMSRSDMVAKRKGQNSLGATAGCDLYEVRPRKSGDGFDLISELFRYGPIWFAGPDAVRNAVAYAKYRSLSRSHQAKIRVLDDFGAVIQTH
jgi:hypothetical protein